ncbi:MAG: POTRA domain-containing protein, partial [Cyanobacteria bacterium J06559_3]
MRQSPRLLAFLTISATLGFATQARGQSLPTLPQETDEQTAAVAELVTAPAPPEAVSLPTLSSVANLDASPALTVEVTPGAAAAGAQSPAADATAEPDAATLPVQETAKPSAAVYKLSDSPARDPASAEAGAAAIAAEGETTGTEAPTLQLSTSPVAPDSVSVHQLRQQQETAEPVDDQTVNTTVATDATAIGASQLEALEEILAQDADPTDDTETESVEPGATEEDDATEAVEDAEDTEADEEDAEEEEGTQPGGLDVDRAPQETQVLVAEVAVTDEVGVPLSPELEDTIYDTIDTIPGRTTTRSQIQRDINSIFATGFFANVRAVPTDTPLGVRVTFLVEPNPVLSRVEVEGDQVLPEEIVEEIFSPQYGEIINLLEFQDGIVELNEWYQENGYVLAQVIAAPEIQDDGVVTLQVAE